MWDLVVGLVQAKKEVGIGRALGRTSREERRRAHVKRRGAAHFFPRRCDVYWPGRRAAVRATHAGLAAATKKHKKNRLICIAPPLPHFHRFHLTFRVFFCFSSKNIRCEEKPLLTTKFCRKTKNFIKKRSTAGGRCAWRAQKATDCLIAIISDDFSPSRRLRMQQSRRIGAA